jgi:hypothetical protein
MQIDYLWRFRITAKTGGLPAPRAAACLVHDLLTIAKGY